MHELGDRRYSPWPDLLALVDTSLLQLFPLNVMNIFLHEFGNEFFNGGSSSHFSQIPITKCGAYIGYPWFHPHNLSFDLGYF